MNDRLAPIILITGTDTDVGKTITTAALATALAATGRTVAVDKPVQTGVRGAEQGDVDEIVRLTGIRAVGEGIRLRAAMAPLAAAAHQQHTLPVLEEHLARVESLSAHHDHVLVEGAGGLLVRLTASGQTIADLAGALGPAADLLVVTRAGLGTLNHTELTLEALAHRGLRARGLVIGDWPAMPGPVEVGNHAVLQMMGTPLLGRIPHGASDLPGPEFRRRASTWFRALPAEPPEARGRERERYAASTGC
ncbi:dethiobiotin synthase [Microbacterium sp. X-17]|uniref:dethiobiotin synthase n=1 Tax=Microbacterium sp. X-17 TaxID=3144404 RepID=UPI0031F57BB9